MSITRNPEHIEIVAYNEAYRPYFERLNRAWIEEFFSVEAADEEVFTDPQRKVIASGGQIFFVLEGGEVKGTCAVLRQSARTYELAKMAVAPSAQRRGFGDLLMQAALAFAQEAGAEEMILSSNTKLKAALRLYEKYGFQPVPHPADTRYQRVDIMMRRALTKTRLEKADG